MEYPPSSYGKEIKNMVPRMDGAVERLGYRNFFGLVVALFKANRSCKYGNVKVRMDFTLPIKWL